MAHQERPAAPAKKVGPTPATPRKGTSTARTGPRVIEIGPGVRMHCREISSDLAIVRFICAAPRTHLAVPGRAGARRTRRPAAPS
jgi:hypothetical protein